MKLKEILNSSVIQELLKDGLVALCSIVLTVITKNYINRKNKIEHLFKENESLKKIIEKYENLKEKEHNIDKSQGSIYIETINSFGKRYICGYCWEELNKTIPIVPDFNDNIVYNLGATCNTCKRICDFQYLQEDNEEEDDDSPW